MIAEDAPERGIQDMGAGMMSLCRLPGGNIHSQENIHTRLHFSFLKLPDMRN
jgi:hypothetical protein